VFDALLADPVWMHEVAIGDGAHPGADGYGHLADLVLPIWRTWLAQAP
jgi:acyl-CoA thioesterase I